MAKKITTEFPVSDFPRVGEDLEKAGFKSHLDSIEAMEEEVLEEEVSEEEVSEEEVSDEEIEEVEE